MNKKEYIKQRKLIVKLKNKKWLICQKHREINTQLWTAQNRTVLQLKICELQPNPEYDKNTHKQYKAYTKYKENYELEHKPQAEQIKIELEKNFPTYRIILKEVRIRIPSMPKKHYNTIAEITKILLTENKNNHNWEYMTA